MKKQLCLLLLVTINFNLVWAGEKDLYDFLWLDPDKSVFVLQNKLYPKDKTFYLDLGYVNNLSSTFQDTSGVQIKLGYYFKEEWAFEFDYMSYGNADNTTLKSVEVVAGLSPFIRRPISNKSLFLIWSPFYGKINTFNRIYYFDWSFGFGMGSMEMESNLDTAALKTENRFDEENYTTYQFKTNLKFHITKNFHLGLEFLNTNFSAYTPADLKNKKLEQSNDLILNLGVSF